MTDWEARALPTEARCGVWYEQGGTWHRTTNEIDGAFCMGRGVRSSYPSDADKPLWRPWKDNNPATWSEFFTATHPPIPEGLERIGAWRTGQNAPRDLPLVFLEDGSVVRDPGLILGSVWFCEVRRTLPAIPAGWEAVGEWHDTLSPCSEVYDWTLLQDGRIVQRGEAFRTNGERIMGVHIRRVFSAVDWGDVPRGVELDPDKGAVMLVTSDGHAVTHGIVWFAQGVWRSATTMEHDAQRADSLPAAIVALTGRRK